MEVAGKPIAVIEQWFTQGVAHIKAGRWAEAEAVYRDMLAQGADAPSVRHNLGVALKSQGKSAEAIDQFRVALAQQANFPDARNNLGDTLREMKRPAEAIQELRRALALRPEFPNAWNNLGIALFDAEQQAEAVEAFRRAVAQRPNFTEAWNNLARTLQGLNRLPEAVEAFRKAVEISPDVPETWNNFGGALRDLRQLPEAIEACRRAVALRPDFAVAWNNMGIVLRDTFQPMEAVAAFRRTLALQGDRPDTLGNLAVVLKDTGQLDEALACYERRNAMQSHGLDRGDDLYALYFHPGYDARAIFEKSRRWNERFAGPLRAEIAPHDNEPAPSRRLRIGYVSPDFRRHCVALFMLPLLSHHDHREFEIICYSSVPTPDAVTARHKALADGWRDIAGVGDSAVAQMVRGDKIDILVDLTLHMASSRLGVFARKAAPIQVTWLGYAGTTGMDGMDYRLTDPRLDPPDLEGDEKMSGTARAACPHAQSAVSWAKQAIGVNQDTADSLGSLAVPLDRIGFQHSYYSERSVYLPDSYWCYGPNGMEDTENGDMPVPAPSPALAGGRVTFGCLNNFSKVTDPALALWGKVMAAVPNSQLLMVAPPGEPRAWVVQKLGVTPDRVAFLGYQNRCKYLETYHRIDICLDPLPCNGGTTSLDALWMGVPVVTRVGRTAVGRAGLSLLHNLDLTELAAWSDDQFVKIAVELAGDLDRLSRLRTTLRPRMESSPLMDGPGFARNIEAAFRKMWQAWCRVRQ